MATPNETIFEETIANFLGQSPLYIQRQPQDFDINRMVDAEILLRFLQKQDSWSRLVRDFRNEREALDEVIDEINRQVLQRQVPLLTLLHKGITVRGRKLRLLQFKPDRNEIESEWWQLYQENRFGVIRQFRYSTQAADHNNEIDLAITVNGLPIITMELKNETTDQNVTHGMEQYRKARNPQNHILRSCLVHFVADNNRVMMTTRLAGSDTRFLPFNKDTKNEQVEGKYATYYLWEQILQADSLLNLIQHFIKWQPAKKNGELGSYIFPRYHQLRAVRAILSDLGEKGVGENYLIQHSAGSGKTKSMAWLAHQLANMQRPDGEGPMFDSIIMVTDRIVLDRNIAKEIKGFEEVSGTVKDIRKGSKNLAKALEEGHRIIISTVQKFNFALPHINKLKGSRFGVIIDEAHTALGKEAAKDIRMSLTSKEDRDRSIEEFEIETDDLDDKKLAEIQLARKLQMGHISYFAFTATPKPATYALYGKDCKAFDYYTMRQAIEEGFILDVLQNYMTFKQMFELVEGAVITEDEKKEYDKANALKVLMSYVNEHPYTLGYKAEMIVRYFMDRTSSRMNGQAKAIVVTASRADAIRYKQAVDRVLHDKYSDATKSLVAFSGSVELNEHKYTEESINGFGIKDNAIAEAFNTPEYRILIVANKFQTGFDQPLLHTMFVDRTLGGVQCIQTLSRLNRCHPAKQDTLVIDFRNTFEDVQRAFEPYYERTSMEGTFDVRRLYDLKMDIENYKVYTEDNVKDVVSVLLDPEKDPVVLTPLLNRIIDSNVVPMEKEEQQKLRKYVNRYIRQYGLLSQIMLFLDVELERFYMFCKLFYKFLPYDKETLPVELLNKIDLNKFKIQLEEEGAIVLEEGDKTVNAPNGTYVSGSSEREQATLATLLHELNEPYEGFLTEKDKVIYAIVEEMKEDPELIRAFQVGNTKEVLRDRVKQSFTNKAYDKVDKYLDLIETLNNNPEFGANFFDVICTIMTEYTAMSPRPTYDKALLKDALEDAFSDDFEPLCGVYFRDLDEVLDCFMAILETQTADGALNGLTDIVKDTLNNYYRGTDLRPIDFRSFLETLTIKFEGYLRKVYLLREGHEVPMVVDAETGLSKRGGLKHTMKQFRQLWGLYNQTDDRYARFKSYYDILCQWRNESGHLAINITDDDLKLGLHLITALYIYSAMISQSELEANGFYAE